MRTKKEHMLFAAVLLLAAGTVLGGCAKKTGLEQQTKTTSSMQKVESNIQQVASQIEETNSSLNKLVSAPPMDLQRAFEEYTEDVKAMEASGNQLLSQMNDMNAQGNEYFEEWRKEGQTYVNPEIRKLSEERRVELRRTFTNIADASIGVRGALNQYLSEVSEIRNYLSNNLSEPAVKAIAPISARTIADGRNLKEQLKPVQTALDQARSQMRIGGVAAGGAGANDESDSSGAMD